MALRLRLALVVAVLAMVLVTGGSVAFALSMSAGTRATIEHSLRRRAQRVGAQLRAGTLSLVTGGARPAPNVDQSTVQVIAPSGQLVYTTAAAGPAVLVTASVLAHARVAPVWVQRQRRVWNNPRLVLVERAGPRAADFIVVGASLDQVIDTSHRVDHALELAGPLLIVASAAGAWLLAGAALRPVERLRAQVQQIATTDSRERLVPPRTRDELAALAVTFNELLDRLRASLDRQRQFLAAASHELRTPLAALGAELEMVTHGVPGTNDLTEVTGRLSTRVAELVHLADGLLVLAQADEGAVLVHVELQPLEPLVVLSLGAHQMVAERRGVLLVLDADPLVEAPVDAIRIRQVVVNLVDNAIRHSPRGTLVAVGLRRVGAEAVVDVRDHGPGFPEDFLPHAFERFSRADPSRSREQGGAGLGLAIVWTIVNAHHGTVTVANAHGGGALATVTLPLQSDLSMSTPTASER